MLQQQEAGCLSSNRNPASAPGTFCSYDRCDAAKGGRYMHAADLTQLVLMYFVLPLWLAAGFADYLCHRASNIATTSGAKESVLHFLQFGEMAIPLLAAIFLEINALVFAVMIVCFLLHEATALWDVSYASQTREVSPVEQHVHSF